MDARDSTRLRVCNADTFHAKSPTGEKFAFGFPFGFVWENTETGRTNGTFGTDCFINSVEKSLCSSFSLFLNLRIQPFPQDYKPDVFPLGKDQLSLRPWHPGKQHEAKCDFFWVTMWRRSVYESNNGVEWQDFPELSVAWESDQCLFAARRANLHCS